MYKDIFKNKIIYMLHKSISHNLICTLRVIIFLFFFKSKSLKYIVPLVHCQNQQQKKTYKIYVE